MLPSLLVSVWVHLSCCHKMRGWVVQPSQGLTRIASLMGIPRLFVQPQKKPVQCSLPFSCPTCLDHGHPQALDTTEQMSTLLQQEQDKTKKLEAQNDTLAKALRQLEMQLNTCLLQGHRPEEHDAQSLVCQGGRQGSVQKFPFLKFCQNFPEWYISKIAEVCP